MVLYPTMRKPSRFGKGCFFKAGEVIEPPGIHVGDVL